MNMANWIVITLKQMFIRGYFTGALLKRVTTHNHQQPAADLLPPPTTNYNHEYLCSHQP